MCQHVGPCPVLPPRSLPCPALPPRSLPCPAPPAPLTSLPRTSCPTHLPAPQKKEFPYNLEQSLFGRELNIPKVAWVLLCTCLIFLLVLFLQRVCSVHELSIPNVRGCSYAGVLPAAGCCAGSVLRHV